jgi:hypothetical protein
MTIWVTQLHKELNRKEVPYSTHVGMGGGKLWCVDCHTTCTEVNPCGCC